MPNYPAKIDDNVSLPVARDNFTPVSASIFNPTRNAVVAIESVLGTQPAGLYGTVKGRLDTLDTTIGNLQIIEIAEDIGGTLESPLIIGIQGRPVSNISPGVGQVLSWDGIAWIPATVNGGGGTVIFAGDLSGTSTFQEVIRINGSTVPPGGSLIPGNVLQVNGGVSLTYAPINLAGGSNFVSGVLPITNLPTLAGDVSGPITTSKVIALQGNFITPQVLGSPQNGYVLTWNNSISQWQAQAPTGGGSGLNQLTGDVLAGPGTGSQAATVTKIQGNSVEAQSLGSLQDGYVLTWHNASSQNQWLPQTSGGAPSGPAGGDLSGSYPNPILATSGVSAATYGNATHVGQVAIDAKGRITSAVNILITGTVPGGLAGGDLSGTYPNPTVATSDGYTIVTNATLAGGDLSGTYPNPFIQSLSGNDGSGGVVNIHANSLLFDKTQTNPTIVQAAQTTDFPTQSSVFSAQSAWSGAITNTNGGDMSISSGAGTTGTNSGILHLQTGGTDQIYVTDTSIFLLTPSLLGNGDGIVAINNTGGLSWSAGGPAALGIYGDGSDGDATCDGYASVSGMTLVTGSAATVSSVSTLIPFGTVATLTGLTNITFDDVGRNMIISGADTPANNGTFPIVEVLSATSCVIQNAGADAGDANNGSINWDIPNLYLMTRDVTFNSLTVNSGIIVNPIGFRILALNLINNGHIEVDGGMGAPDTTVVLGGGGQGTATLVGGTYGWGGADATPASHPGLGGQGGVGGVSASVPGTVDTPQSLGYSAVNSIPAALTMATYGTATNSTPLAIYSVGGGTGGGLAGAGAGPGGGSGAGVMVIIAEFLSGSGSFTANGGMGGTSNGDGAGGGGGGGVLVFITRHNTFAGTMQVNGGAAGDNTAGGGDQTAQPGNPGTIIQLTA